MFNDFFNSDSFQEALQVLLSLDKGGMLYGL